MTFKKYLVLSLTFFCSTWAAHADQTHLKCENQARQLRIVKKDSGKITVRDDSGSGVWRPLEEKKGYSRTTEYYFDSPFSVHEGTPATLTVENKSHSGGWHRAVLEIDYVDEEGDVDTHETQVMRCK